MQSAQKKEREFENDKMLKINEKGKELERMKEEVNSLNGKLSKQKIEYRKKEEEVEIKKQAIQKLEEKIKEDDILMIESKKSYEDKLEDFRTKEILLKNYKEEIKGMQWEVQR